MIARLRRRLEPAIRRGFHLYWRLRRGLTLGVRAVVINAAGEVFLVKHSYVAGWHLPGGGVEPGETALQALARELLEEGNITVTAPPVLHAVLHNALASPRDHVAVYVVRHFTAAPPQRNYEIIDHGFFAPDALPSDATRGTRARISEVLRGSPISATW